MENLDRPLPVGKGYAPETQYLVESSMQTARGLESYADVLGFSCYEDLVKCLPERSLTLDLGSGYGLFAKELALVRPDILCVNVNPTLAQKRFVKDQKEFFLSKGPLSISLNLGGEGFGTGRVRRVQKRHDRFAMAVMSPHLPFKDGEFNTVFDSMASVYYAAQGREIENIIEIIRVVRNGGFAFLGPVVSDSAYYRICEFLDGRSSELEYQLKLACQSYSSSGGGTAFHIRKK